MERYLRNYGHQGILEELAALLVARPMNYPSEWQSELAARIEGVLGEFGRSSMPVVLGLDAGHTSPLMVTPLGARIRVDPVGREIISLESAVR